MKLWHLILLLGNCFHHWTSAAAHGTYRPIIRGLALANVEITGDPISVNLSNLLITEIHDKAFDALTNVEVLDLSGNGIITLPYRLFSKLNNLRELSLACPLNQKVYYNPPFYSDGFHGLNNLMHLDLRGRQIFKLNSGYFAGLQKFVNITVSPGSMADVSTAVFKDVSKVEETSRIEAPLVTNSPRLTNDTMTYSHHQMFNFRRDIIENLPSNIKRLDLDHNRFYRINCTHARNDYLRTLSLDSNRITTIEDHAFQLLLLTSLNLRHNQLRSTNFIRTLPKTLRKLDLSGNPIKEIPSGTFSGLKNLKVLTMMWNQLETLQPGTFDGPEDLLEIDFSNGKIKKIHPGTFRGLRLLTLHLYLNKLKIIETGALSYMSSKDLDLGWNDISSIEKGAFSGSHIQKISLWHNKMVEFKKESFDGISGVINLLLSDNPLKTIEKGSMLNLKEVRYLNLRRTKLEVLENGMLFGLSDDANVRVRDVPIRLIQGGVFDDV